MLGAIQRERRVAWILLSNASVLSVQDGILTLRFARDGDLKGFSTSGCDADLQRVLSSRFGLNVTVKGVVGGDSGPGPAGPAPGPPDPGPGTAGPGTSRPAAPRPEAAPRPGDRYDEPPEEMPSEEDEPPPDEPPARRSAAPAELTGMDLIQHELGGQVIGEVEG